MVKSDLVTYLATAEDLPAAKARSVVDTLLDLMALGLMQDRRLKIHSFGTFKVGKRREHENTNPITGQRVKLPVVTTVLFKPSDDLTRRINLK